MAVESKLILRGEDKSKAAFKSARKSADSLKKSLKGLIGSYAAFRAVSSVIAIHRKFGAAISDLAAITGAAGKDLEFFRQKSKEIGETTTLSASQAAEAFKLVASAKPDLLDSAEALAQVTKEVVLLAEASGSELPEAAKTVGSALNQFSAGAEEAARFVNVLAAGAKFGASEIADTAEALKVAGLVASAAGTSFEETNAAIQAMSTVSLKGSEAGTGLRNVYLNLAKQSRSDFKPEVVGLTQALRNMKAEGLTTNEMLDIFGKKNIVAARALIKTSDGLETLTDKMTGTLVAVDQANIKFDNLDGDIRRMESAWETAAITVGEDFDPALRSVTQLLGSAAKFVSGVSLAVTDMGDAIGAFAAKVTALLSGNMDQVRRINELRRETIAINEAEFEAIFNKTAAESQNMAATEMAAAAEKARAESQIKLAEINAAQRLAASEEEQAAIDRSNFAFEEQMRKRIESFNRALMTETELENEKFLQRQLTIEEEYLLTDISEEEHNKKMLDVAAKHEEALSKISKKGNKNRIKVNAEAGFQIALAALNVMAIVGANSEASSKSEFESQKKLSMASIVVNTASAAMKAYNSAGNPYLGAILAALVVAAGAAQLSKVSSTSYGGGSSAPSAPASPSASGGSSQTSQSAPPPQTQIQAQQQQSNEQETKIIINLDGEPILNYVGKSSKNGTLMIDSGAVR